MRKLLHEKTSYAIIGAAMEVHSCLGYGYLESVYEKALLHELQLRGLSAENQIHIPVKYKDVEVGNFFADIVINDQIILELKASSNRISNDHIAQTINYLTATGYELGFVFNFGRPSLEKKRLVRSSKKDS